MINSSDLTYTGMANPSGLNASGYGLINIVPHVGGGLPRDLLAGL